MGLEARARAHLDGTTRDGLLQLEEAELVFRGDDQRRLRIPLASIRTLDATRGVLSVVHAGGRASFALAAAERWAERIRSPRGRLDKLGISRGTVVHLRGVEDESLRRELEVQGAVLRSKLTASVEVVLFYVPSAAALVSLDAIRHGTSDAVSIWAIWRKGQKELTEDHIRAAARSRELVDVKVAKVSETLSGLKLVVRRELRSSAGVARPRARPSARAKAVVALPPVTKPNGNGTAPRLPSDLSSALSARTDARTKWDALPLSHRRRYVSWIEEAKRPATRKKRIDEALTRLGRP